MPTPAIEGVVVVPGARLRSVDVGAAGPGVVVLHGGPGASLDYLRPQMDRLARRRRLFYYDQRGGGGSVADDPRTPVTAEVLVGDLEALREAQGGRRLVLLGYSWGALLALLYAVHYREAVERMVLVSSAPARWVWREAMERNLAARAVRPGVRALANEAESLRKVDPERARRLRFAAAVGGYFVDPRRALEMTPFLVTTRTQRSVWESLTDHDLLPELAGVTAPTLLVHGAADPVPLECSRELAEAMPQARLIVLPEAAHVPFIEDAERFFGEVDAFLPRE